MDLVGVLIPRTSPVLRIHDSGRAERPGVFRFLGRRTRRIEGVTGELPHALPVVRGFRPGKFLQLMLSISAAFGSW
jgi:hypothetical protein